MQNLNDSVDLLDSNSIDWFRQEAENLLEMIEQEEVTAENIANAFIIIYTIGVLDSDSIPAEKKKKAFQLLKKAYPAFGVNLN